MPRFSIITICYNEEHRIRKTMESVLEQTLSDYEYILEDGGSTDTTLDVINHYRQDCVNHTLHVFSERDGGLYDAMNRALARTSGELICFLNSGDMLFEEETLAKVSEVVEAAPDYDIYCGSAVIRFPNGNEWTQVSGNVTEHLKRERDSYLSNAGIAGDIIHQAIFARKECFEGNVFNTDYHIRAELDWYYQCLNRGYRFYALRFPTCVYTYGGLSERAGAVRESIRETRMVIREHGYDSFTYDLGMENRYVSAQICKNLYNKWLELKHRGGTIGNYFEDRGIRKIAVYGYGEIGNHLASELRGSKTEIVYWIDRAEKYPYAGIRVIRPEQMREMGMVDRIVIAAIHYEEEIRSICEKFGFAPVISIEDVLDEMLEGLGTDEAQ